MTSNQTIAQFNYTTESPTNNPFNGIDVGDNAAPAFVDIDNDGDKDCFVGEKDLGIVNYFENIGSASSPNFIQRTGSANPLDNAGGTIAGINGELSKPTFVDIDNDGDFDCFVGHFLPHPSRLGLQYFKNTGTASSPNFVLQTDRTLPQFMNPNDPFHDMNFNAVISPAFADMDGDGDKDCFINHNQYLNEDNVSNIPHNARYYLNIGTAASPTFIQQNGDFNPISGIDLGFWTNITLVDFDGDGDQDCLVGNYGGELRYLRHVGLTQVHTIFAPEFMELTGTNNPFHNITNTFGSIPQLAPAFVDINADGDPDVFIGKADGTIDFVSAAPVSLPAELLSFDASPQDHKVQLNWLTAVERGVESFTVEKSIDGKLFSPLSIDQARGTNSRYRAFDNKPNEGINYYRLKINDLDGYSVYSKIESVWFQGGKRGAKVYPTLVSSDLNIEETGLSAVQIVNALGRVIWQVSRQTDASLLVDDKLRVNMSGFPKGIYLVQVQNTEGGLSTEKIFKN